MKTKNKKISTNINALLFITVLCILLSCCQNPTNTGSNNHRFLDTAVSRLLDSFGGICKYDVQFTSDNFKESNTNIILNLTSSPVIKNNFEYLNYYASTIAHIFYLNVPNFKTTYNNVIVQIPDSNNVEKEYKFNLTELENITLQLENYKEVVKLLSNKNWPEIENKCEAVKDFPINKEEFMNALKTTENSFTQINSYFILGIDKFKSTNNSNLIKIGGILLREKRNTEFSVVVKQNSKNRKIVMCNFSN